MAGAENFATDTIRISLGGDCGFACGYCFLGDEDRGGFELPIELGKELLAEAASLGFVNFSFIGREPLHDIELLLDLAGHGKKMGMHYSAFYSNGLKLGDYPRAREIFATFKARGFAEIPLALSLDKVKLEQLSRLTGNAWDHVMGIVRALREVYPGGQLELGRVTLQDGVVAELLRRLGDTATEVHSFDMETSERRSLCYFPSQLIALESFFGGFASLKHAYLIYLADGTQLMIHNREFSDVGRGQAFLAQHPDDGLADQDALKKEFRDTVYVDRIGRIFLSYIHLAQRKKIRGRYLKKGDLAAALKDAVAESGCSCAKKAENKLDKRPIL